MGKYKKLFVAIILIFIMGFLAWTIYLPKDSFSNKDIIFNIEKGQGSREISLNLEKTGLIKWAPLFRLYVLTVGIGGTLQAGSYSLNSAMTIPQIAEKFAKGEVVKNIFTVIEGWNLKDMGFAFENKGMFQAEELWEVAGFPAVDYSKPSGLERPLDFSPKFSFLKGKPDSVGLEGYLFPDTYQIGQSQQMEEIIEMMLANFDKKMTMDLKAEINRQGKTIFEVITMASLVEKEVQTSEDKELVSGILWNRLEINMPLQVDATISYITGKQGARISKEDTQINSPFNTYKYGGLSLGPISNPGIESIKAVLYPKESPYLYYLSTPEGKTIFSKTLGEHNVAKAKYLR